MRSTFSYFTSSLVVTVVGLLGGAIVGYVYGGGVESAFKALFLTAVLAVLEVSLSFDNAVINASVLRDMSEVWRRRFLTWGILIAVFGMRLIFPLIIVAVVAQVGPIEALRIAVFNPDEYARIMLSSHFALAGFGGAFLMMVAFGYFIDREKETHWLGFLERPLVFMGKIEAVGLAVTVLIFILLGQLLDDPATRLKFIEAGLFGMVTYVAVSGLSNILTDSTESHAVAAKSGFAMFMYLEVLDASFSFDGVIGAFALTHNIFLIAIGLGIGGMFVRSMTIYLVDKGTLQNFIFLEHGAFYAIGALALFMLLDAFIHVPEAVTGLVGAVLIGLSVYSSIRHRRNDRLQGEPDA